MAQRHPPHDATRKTEMTEDSSMDHSAPHVAIVGAGLGGLAAACTLAARGYQVTIFDRNDWLGGKAAILKDSGFRFDMGPTILLMPSVLKKIFGEAGQRVEDALDLVELDPQWRCFFPSGDTLDLHKSTARTAQDITALAGPNAGHGYEDFMQTSGRLRDISDKFFFYKSVGGIRDTFDFKGSMNLTVLKDLLALRMGSTVAGTVRKHVRDERVAQMVDHFTQYVGSAPDQSPAVLCSIGRMQTDEGLWYPIGGTGAVPQALCDLALSLGVQFRAGEAITGIAHDADGVHAVMTDRGERISVDAVISNSDVVRTHDELLSVAVDQRFKRRRSYEAACSGVVLYLGLNKRYDHLLHHNFVFSSDAHAEFKDIYKRGEPASDLTAYVCAPARTDPAVAPAGGEALYVLVHAPYLRPHHDWKTLLPTYRQAIIEKLKTTAGLADIEDCIVYEHALTPQDINDRYHVWRGAIYGLASHGRMMGAFKPANRSPDVARLYFAGGSVHPGPGMPMVMMSGWIAADTLDQDFRGASPNRDKSPSRGTAVPRNEPFAPLPIASVATPESVPQ
jgi:diapolycopene oxygenase